MRSFTFDAFAGVIASPGWTPARATAAIAMNVNAASAASTIRLAAVHSRALRTSLLKCSMSYLLLGGEIGETKQLGCHQWSEEKFLQSLMNEVSAMRKNIRRKRQRL